MRRLVLIFILSCVAGFAAYAVFLKTRTGERKPDCELCWLSRKLALTAEQTTRVRTLHLQFCPEMRRVECCCEQGRQVKPPPVCGATLEKLVEAVCAELTPVQREKYLELIRAKAACGRPCEAVGAMK